MHPSAIPFLSRDTKAAGRPCLGVVSDNESIWAVSLGDDFNVGHGMELAPGMSL